MADSKGFATIGEYENGQPGEIFLTVSKQAPRPAASWTLFAKSITATARQYGVPPRSFVEAFVNSFEPAGM
ncbi:MAG: hypothetical protein H6513_15470 [Acidimicrobiaceae bacterium]|nr:hypothetical protein [Acidimicrobiaceae bacterium]